MRVPTTWVLGLVLLATSQRASALNVTRGPYLQLLTTHSVTVLWQTNGPGRCGVALRAADGSIAEIDGATGGVCVVPVDGLDQGTAYAYTPLADGVPVAPESVFRTDDPRAPHRTRPMRNACAVDAAPARMETARSWWCCRRCWWRWPCSAA